MENTIEMLGNLAFAFIFALLGLFLIFLHIPKNEKLKYYRRARMILGTAFIVMTVYCILEAFIHVRENEYTHDCLLILFSLIFSWLNYSTFLTLIMASRIVRKRFYMDGVIPISLMVICAVAGFAHPEFQKINATIFGIIFGAKCLWMFYTCMKEYRKVMNELDNFYDEAPDIKWMYNLIWLTMILSVSTMISFYIPVIDIIYIPAAIIIYIYMTFKMVNYLPVRIERIRNISVEETEETQEMEIELQKKQTKQISSKMEPLVKAWIEKKHYKMPDITIKDAAAEMGTNHNYLSRYLNQSLETTFTIWLNSLRIEESKAMLVEETSMSIEEVGKAVGIPQLYNFSKWFKTITGTTPYQYRKANTSK